MTAQGPNIEATRQPFAGTKQNKSPLQGRSQMREPFRMGAAIVS